MNIKIEQIIKSIKQRIVSACKTEHEAEQQAWWMLEELTNKNQVDLLLKKQISLSGELEKILDEWIYQRVQEKKPLQYILGYVQFCNLKILVKPPTLIPRPETEEWCLWLIEKLKKVEYKKLNIIDLGSGSGCISLSLAKALKDSVVIGIDLDSKAIELAKENKKLNKIKNAFFIKYDFYKNLTKKLKDEKLFVDKFDLIVSNPPYIAEDEWKNLSDTVKNWEDKKALIAKNDGFEAFEKIISGAKKNLKKNKEFEQLKIPQLVLEIGKGQENGVIELLKSVDFKDIEVFCDINGIKRWVSASPSF